MLTQENFEKLSTLMADHGVVHEAFELLADLRQSEQKAIAERDALRRGIQEIIQKIESIKTDPDFSKGCPYYQGVGDDECWTCGRCDAPGSE